MALTPDAVSNPLEQSISHYLIPKNGHWAATQIRTSPQRLADVPDVFQVCQFKIALCCQHISQEDILPDLYDICSKIGPGKWLGGQW